MITLDNFDGLEDCKHEIYAAIAQHIGTVLLAQKVKDKIIAYCDPVAPFITVEYHFPEIPNANGSFPGTNHVPLRLIQIEFVEDRVVFISSALDKLSRDLNKPTEPVIVQMNDPKFMEVLDMYIMGLVGMTHTQIAIETWNRKHK